MDVEYLKREVGPVIAQAVNAVLEHNPVDPVYFVGHYVSVPSKSKNESSQL